jgi:hypothetical protein
MRCVLETENVVKRTQEVARLLQPIAPRSLRTACRPRWLERNYFLCAYIGPEPSDPDPDEWRFPTRIANIRASYHERWIPTDYRRRNLFLERAYLHLFIRGPERTEKQILALHCDPNEPESERHFRYKAGPHVHMSTAGDPLHRSHIALNVDNLEEVLRSVTTITTALSQALAMIDEQVLGLF